MALKKKVNKTEYDTMTDTLRTLYRAEGADFVLDLEGDNSAALETELNNLRTQHQTINQQLTTVRADLAKYKDVDPAKYQELLALQSALEKKGIKKADEVDSKIVAFVEEKQKPLADKVAALESTNTQLITSLDREKVDAALMRVGLQRGLADTAVDDFLGRVHSTWKRVEGKLVAMDGETVVTGEKGTPITPEEWVSGLITGTGKHLFKDSKGGGAENRGGGHEQVLVDPDPLTFGKNLDDIAKGKITVQRS